MVILQDEIMSTINKHFTFNYSQPEEYRFSHDSVFLAREVFEYLQSIPLKSTNSPKVLDVCSGCGVIGLDLAFHILNSGDPAALPLDLEFLEIQSVYLEHFQANVESLKRLFPSSQISAHFLNFNYEALLEADFKNKYDLIVCNPPYFLPHQGKLSPSEFKNRCRFFLDSNLQQLISGISHALKDGGKAFILLRDLSDHGLDQMAVVQQALQASAHKVSILKEIRGTPVILIE